MNKTNKKVSCAVLLVAGLFLSGSALAGMRCFTNQQVVHIKQGYVDSLLGPDGGHAIHFKLDNGQVFPINSGLNLNDAPGKAHLQTLQLSLIGGYKIEGWDHYGWGGTCDDIDELIITR